MLFEKERAGYRSWDYAANCFDRSRNEVRAFNGNGFRACCLER